MIVEQFLKKIVIVKHLRSNYPFYMFWVVCLKVGCYSSYLFKIFVERGMLMEDTTHLILVYCVLMSINLSLLVVFSAV